MIVNGTLVTRENWEDTLKASNDSARPFVAVQARLARSIGPFEGELLTGPLLGWLIFASRAFQAAEDGRALVRSLSPFAVTVLQRCVGDSVMDLTFVLGTGEPGVDDEGRVDRLGAYAAWCLWNDANDADRVLNHRDLNRAYDQSETIALASDPTAAQLFGDLLSEMETDPRVLRSQRLDHEESLHERSERMRGLARALNLDRWIITLDERVQQKPCHSLRELVTGAPLGSLVEHKRRGITFAHTLYRHQSSVAHGSTAYPFVYVGDDQATPLISHPEAALQPQHDALVGEIDGLAFLLELAARLIGPGVGRGGLQGAS